MSNSLIYYKANLNSIGGRPVVDLDFFDSVFKNSNIVLKLCNEAYHTNKWTESSFYSDYDIWIILEGTINVVINNQKYIARPGDAVFFAPNYIYSANTEDSGCRFIYMHFDFVSGSNPQGLDIFDLTGYIPGNVIENDLELFMQNYRMYKNQQPLSFFMLKGSLILLLSRIVIHQYIRQKPNKNNSPSSKKLHRLYPAINHISCNFQRKIFSSELAMLCNLSEKYFITLFKKSLGISPGNYIIQLRMNMALEYINEQRYSVKEIANMIGYPDQYSFSKAFKNYYGTAPSKLKM